MLNNLELADQPFFLGIPPESLAPLAMHASLLSVNTGSDIFHEGEEADRFFLVLSGRVGLQIHVPAVGDTSVAPIRPGEALGWSWLFRPYRWHFDARALEPVTMLCFDAVALRALCDSDHDLGYAVLARIAEVITQRLQSTRLQLLDVYGAQPAYRAHTD